MIEDTLLTFADAADMGNTGTRVIGSVVDLRSLGVASNAGLNSQIGGLRDVGSGQPVYVFVTVDTAMVMTGSDHSYIVKLVTGNDSDLSDAVVLIASADTAASDVVAGTVLLNTALPLEGTAYRRYIGIQEVVVGTTTTGKLNAALTLNQRSLKTYAQASVGFTGGA